MITIDGDGAGRRIVRELADTARDEDADVRLAAVRRLAQPGGAHRLAAPRVHLFVGQRDGQRDHAGRVPQPPHVPIEEKRLAVVGAPRLVDALAVQKAVIEDRDDGVLLIEHAAVDVDRGCHRFEAITLISVCVSSVLQSGGTLASGVPGRRR